MGLLKKKKATRIKRVSMLEDSGIATSRFSWGWKAVEADLTARNGFRYKVGAWAVAANPDKSNKGPCPEGDDGDGLCIARNFYGAAQGGRSCRTILICAYLSEEVPRSFVFF